MLLLRHSSNGQLLFITVAMTSYLHGNTTLEELLGEFMDVFVHLAVKFAELPSADIVPLRI